VSSEHAITRHRTLVAAEGVELADGVPPFFEETGNRELRDYSGDSGGEWFECRCGAEFTSAEEAHDHIVSEQEQEG